MRCLPAGGAKANLMLNTHRPRPPPCCLVAAFFFHPICTLDMASKIRGLKWQGVWFMDDEG